MIAEYEFSNKGMQRVYENEKWMVGIKNWKPANDISQIDCLERHNKTDELFVLLSGNCWIVYATERSDGLDFGAIKLKQGKVYNIPRSMWHNTVTEKDTKLVLIEDVGTSMDNSDVINLNDKQLNTIKELIK